VVWYYPTVDGAGVDSLASACLYCIYADCVALQGMVWYCHHVDGTNWYHGYVGYVGYSV